MSFIQKLLTNLTFRSINILIILLFNHKWNKLNIKTSLTEFSSELFKVYLDIYKEEGLIGAYNFMKVSKLSIEQISNKEESFGLWSNVPSNIFSKISVLRKIFHNVKITVFALMKLQSILVILVNIMFLPIIIFSVYALCRKIILLFSFVFTSSFALATWDTGILDQLYLYFESFKFELNKIWDRIYTFIFKTIKDNEEIVRDVVKDINPDHELHDIGNILELSPKIQLVENTQDEVIVEDKSSVPYWISWLIVGVIIIVGINYYGPEETVKTIRSVPETVYTTLNNTVTSSYIYIQDTSRNIFNTVYDWFVNGRGGSSSGGTATGNLLDMENVEGSASSSGSSTPKQSYFKDASGKPVLSGDVDDKITNTVSSSADNSGPYESKSNPIITIRDVEGWAEERRRKFARARFEVVEKYRKYVALTRSNSI